MKKLKIFVFTVLFLLVCPNQIGASKASCKYSYNGNYITFHYEYGQKLSYSVSGTNSAKYTKESSNVENKDFVDSSGNIVCPKLFFSHTPVGKGRYQLSIRIGGDVSGTLNLIESDNKEKNPADIQNICVYNEGTNRQISLGWSSGLKVYLEGDSIKDYSYKIMEPFSENDFEGSKCPQPYFLFQAKAKNVLISKETIFTENDNSNTADDNYDVSTGESIDTPDETTDNNSNNSGNYATECDFIGNLSCGNTKFQFHKSLPNFTSTVFDVLKVLTPVIIIITGMLDLLKAVSAQKEDEIKKAQQKLVRRLLAGAIVFLVFVIVETVIHMTAEGNDADNAMDCVNCFLNGSSKCTENPVSCNNGSSSSNGSNSSGSSNGSNSSGSSNGPSGVSSSGRCWYCVKINYLNGKIEKESAEWSQISPTNPSTNGNCMLVETIKEESKCKINMIPTPPRIKTN